ncbi:hypothetical protein JRO89_XS01G0057700 [Xanthoceras sorbifolium]|uniref:Uncharacterized protein n=1 Tax=Xanthoceras sorbifolium TaxID=99658 RepID=A0ABQ8IJ55_9ROSI|nr:hypothetical protein JRO89_XS01G0057700 [Xanthoceras sorbifolium]
MEFSSYDEVHSALEYALTLTYGSLTESYQLLSSYYYVIEQQNPGTVIDMKIAPDGKFVYFFMALGASLRGFINFMRPVNSVDGTYLKDKHKGYHVCGSIQEVSKAKLHPCGPKLFIVSVYGTYQRMSENFSSKGRR